MKSLSDRHGAWSPELVTHDVDLLDKLVHLRKRNRKVEGQRISNIRYASPSVRGCF